MDWMDSKSRTQSTKKSSKNKKQGKRTDPLKQVQAALAQPKEVWSTAFEHEIAGLKWPKSCSLESTWLFSTLIDEQVEVLACCGLNGTSLAGLLKHPDEASATQHTESLRGLASQPLTSKADQWLNEADAYPHAALGVLAIAWHLPELNQRPSGEDLSDWLLKLTQRVLEHQSEPSECLLGNLAFHCELPMLLGLLTSTSQSTAQQIASRPMDDLAEYLENSQDHLGSWLAHGASYLRAALASVFRCRVIADHLGLRDWYPPQRKAIGRLLEHAARWARYDGGQLLSQSIACKAAEPIWIALCKQATSSGSIKNLLATSGLLSADRATARQDQSRPPKLSHFDEEAYSVCMQHSWQQRGARLAADFSENMTSLEVVGPKGQSVFKGNWQVEVACDGQAQLQVDGWHQQCWYSDDEVDYLEMEAHFGKSARVQRQLILIRKRRILLAADALLSDLPGKWSIHSRLPLAESTQWQPNGKHSEGALETQSSRCLVLPLFLPEWQTAMSTGSLTCEASQLVIQNSSAGGRSIYSPVAISLCNRTNKQAYTWRQLTVAEDLRIVRRDEAVGYRIQLGKHQLMIYRNLDQVRRRTLLGVHTLCDFYLASFDKDSGQPETLVEIEQKQ
ncbi:MAG TPA: hypothetical protein DCF63_06695 [Planctomycetaceae bacterium]|nr:hypothetical protein [Planctomycetaceae bacterium]